MAKSTHTSDKDKAAAKKADETAPNLQQPKEENLAQPNKDDKDSQAYIKENAKGGESVHDPLTSKQMREGINVETGGEESGEK